MKNIFIVFLITLSHSIFAQSILKIYIIKPQYKISWQSPSSLILTSALNYIGNDYAPIGHLAIELKCSCETKFKYNHIITAMERISKKESRKIAWREKLGLESLIYTFEGQLASAKNSKFDIEMARKQNRLKTFTIEIEDSKCIDGLHFIDQWIKNNSFLIYGGGKKTLQGEGAGCSDFASALFEITTNYHWPEEWDAQVKIPKKLMKSYSKKRRVSFLKLLFRRCWAKENEKYINFSIGDTDKIFNWVDKEYGANVNEIKLSLKQMNKSLLPSNYTKGSFTFKYKNNNDPEHLWRSIQY